MSKPHVLLSLIKHSFLFSVFHATRSNSQTSQKKLFINNKLLNLRGVDLWLDCNCCCE